MWRKYVAAVANWNPPTDVGSGMSPASEKNVESVRSRPAGSTGWGSPGIYLSPLNQVEGAEVVGTPGGEGGRVPPS